MDTRQRSFLISGLLTIFLTSSSLPAEEKKSTSSVKDTSVQQIKESLSLLKRLTRVAIYDSCFTDMLKNISNGLNDRDLNGRFLLCLKTGFETANKQLGLDVTED